MKNIKTILFLFFSVIMCAFLAILGPFDGFSHGFYSDETDIESISEKSMLETVDLSESFEMSFTPVKKHFAGFSLFIKNVPSGATGNIYLDIIDGKGSSVDQVIIDLSRVFDSTWYKVQVNKKLKINQEYTLRFYASDYSEIPMLQRVKKKYLAEETTSENILISYAYEEPTFTFQNKVLIFILVIGMWIYLLGLVFSKEQLKTISFAVFSIGLMSWIYMYNSIDANNTTFATFQHDSESLVTGVIYANWKGEKFRSESEMGYGMGRFYELNGVNTDGKPEYVTNGNWDDGYSRIECSFVVNSNPYSKEVAVVGNIVKFANGKKMRITEINDDETYIIVYLEGTEPLDRNKYGSLDDVKFFDANGKAQHKGLLSVYASQYGLNGKIFKFLSRLMDKDNAIENLRLLCSLSAAFVFIIIVLLLNEKYDKLMAGCFFVTFILSPWVVNFARNLYWVEFTWFIPMAFGIFCALKIDNRKCRLISYTGIFFAILIKSLCGYEYISVVMMGAILFLLSDISVAAFAKDVERLKILLRTTFCVGIAALAGFFVAICIHAFVVGQGNVAEGIVHIYRYDVLKRTSGVSVDDYFRFVGKEYDALMASHWDALKKYFHFWTDIITGIDGSLFGILCIIPICLFLSDINKKKTDVKLMSLYVFSFLTAMSWYYLARDHSYVHTQLNFVLWYFGFIQICFYIVISKLISGIKSVHVSKEGKND